MAKDTTDEKAAAARGMSPGQQDYEGRRAKAAGLTLDAWLSRKARAAASAASVTAPARAPEKKGKGLIGRLLDRAHRPL